MTTASPLDPLNSPHPIPWNWVLATQTQASSARTPRLRYYRTQALQSPDGCYAAYSRLQMQVAAEFYQSRVSSTLFVENLESGDLHTLTATSPLADNLFHQIERVERWGTIAILIPVAWSAMGDRLLAREFESVFGSDIASDYAVVWDRAAQQTVTLAPTGISYTHAVLLGWSQCHPDRVLFRVGTLGEEDWHCWTVDMTGQTELAEADQPQAFGKMVSNVWMGPQAS